MQPMKRARKWSADTRAGEGPVGEPGGPLRRRRALRRIDNLALDPERDPNPAAAVAHVRVIGETEGVEGGPRVVPRPASGRSPEVADPAGTAAGQDGEGRPPAHRVHAVPIDQPFQDSSRSVAGKN
jgi:hypothetical protein